MEELTQDGAQLARTMLMSAAQLVESVARVQAQRAWMAQSRSTAQAAQAQQQIAAQRDAARMIFRPLTDDRYWRDAPRLDRVVQAYMAAASWAEHDPEARAAVQLIKQHAEERWSREWGDVMRVLDSIGADHDQDLGETPMTAELCAHRSELSVDSTVRMARDKAVQMTTVDPQVRCPAGPSGTPRRGGLETAHDDAAAARMQATPGVGLTIARSLGMSPRSGEAAPRAQRWTRPPFGPGQTRRTSVSCISAT